MISEGSFDIFKYINIENYYLKCQYYFVILQFYCISH